MAIFNLSFYQDFACDNFCLQVFFFLKQQVLNFFIRNTIIIYSGAFELRIER